MEKDAVNMNPTISFGDNKSAYHQAIAMKLAQSGADQMKEKLQAEKRREGNMDTIRVHGIQGLSQG